LFRGTDPGGKATSGPSRCSTSGNWSSNASTTSDEHGPARPSV